MKRLLSILVVAVLLSCILPTFCYADASDLQWGMSKDEVIKAIGTDGERDKSGSPGDELIRYKKVPISEFEVDLELTFRDDKLITKTYGIYEKIGSAYDYLKSALTTKYGSSDYDQDIAVYCFELIGTKMNTGMLALAHITGGIKYETWDNVDEAGTRICLIHLTSNGLTALIYAPPEELVPDKAYNTNGI